MKEGTSLLTVSVLPVAESFDFADGTEVFL